MLGLPPKELLDRYDKPGPRYTSYPTAPVWTDAFGEADHRASLRRANEQPGIGIAQYVHLPFCQSLCWYCGCSVLITTDSKRIATYVQDVLAEAAIARAELTADRPVVQHHWGGGTPTMLSPDLMETLFCGLTELFPLAENAEVSLEADPRVTTVAQLQRLAKLGFNRLSMGVQDFDPVVQESIHRVQPFEVTRDLVIAAREADFHSVNLDLVYGLPHQDPATFRTSVEKVLELQPDRLACYGYAHVPWLKKHQRLIDEGAVPRGADKLALYAVALEVLQDAGYVAVGLDHFARPTDELVRADEAGTLHRNFMGYTTLPCDDMLAFGLTAISEVAGAFSMNHKEMGPWREAVRAGRLPVARGLRRTEDDEARRAVILDLMCRFELAFADHGGRTAFLRRYKGEVAALSDMAQDGLVVVDGDGIHVTERGRFLVRNVAMPFDAYLQAQRAQNTPIFSRTV